MSIPGLDDWIATPAGRHVLAWEQQRIDEVVTDIFGFNALQIGLPACDFLRSNRIPLRQRAGYGSPVDVACLPAALPFANASCDLIVLPHVLEFCEEPHQILREVERILIPEGQLIVTGFNPRSLWGAKRWANCRDEFPWNGTYLALPRLKDWLKLLGFDVDRGVQGCTMPPIERLRWLQRWPEAGDTSSHWWDFAGGIYILRAIKRTHGMRLITPKWKNKPVRAKALRPVAQKEGHGR